MVEESITPSFLLMSPVLLLGQNCSHDNECSPRLMCSGQKCACMPGYRQVQDSCELAETRDGTCVQIILRKYARIAAHPSAAPTSIWHLDHAESFFPSWAVHDCRSKPSIYSQHQKSPSHLSFSAPIEI